MRVVGVKQLEARLSGYLREVGRGEVFLVTDGDRVEAELRPPRSAALPAGDAVHDALEHLFESGEVQPPRLVKADWLWRPRGAGVAPDTAAKLLDELRAERGPAP